MRQPPYICIITIKKTGSSIRTTAITQTTKKIYTMKTLIPTLVILFISAIILIGAEVNYQNANRAAIDSEGTDIAIEQALSLYGFNLAWDEEPTTIQKIVAVFTPTKQTDYSLELFCSGGQPMCRLTNNQFGDMYVCHIDSLVNTLINDNE